MTSIKSAISAPIQSTTRPSIGFPSALDPILATDHPNLVAMYTMDNISGAILFDETSNSYDGTITGATAVAGKIGNSLSADGVNDSVLLPTAALLASKSMSMWLKVTGTDLVRTMTATTTDDSSWFEVVLFGGGKVGINIFVGEFNFLRTVAAFPADIWYHIVVQTDGIASQIWVDGVNEPFTLTSGTDSGEWVSDLNPAPTRANMFLRHNNVTLTYTKGQQDQTRIFDRALTQPEITALYNEGSP